MKIAIVGASGMLGQSLVAEFRNCHEIRPFNSHEFDVTSVASGRSRLREFRPDWLISAAAFTAVDRAEKEAARAEAVNGLGSRNLAMLANEFACRLAVFSTDYVFDGRSSVPYREEDSPNPINRYGSSKWQGERYIQELCENHLIVRTSWLFGPGGRHFVSTMIGLADGGKTIRVVDDQVGAPTYTPDLASATRKLVEGEREGLYHVTNSGTCSWYEFAERIFEGLGREVRLEAIKSSEFPRPAPRPAFSVLENRRWRIEGNPPLRSWIKALAEYLENNGA